MAVFTPLFAQKASPWLTPRYLSKNSVFAVFSENSSGQAF
jgi:hypothetical protein